MDYCRIWIICTKSTAPFNDIYAHSRGVQLKPACVAPECTTIRARAANNYSQILLEMLFFHYIPLGAVYK